MALVFVLLNGCKEIPLSIPEVNAGKRRILVEELTGVRCQNCPDGTRELVGLQNNLEEGQLVIVSIHAAGTYSLPFTNQFDFRFSEAQTLANYIGQPEGFPTASINRRLAAGNNSLFVLRTSWASLITEELARDYGLGLFLNNNYDPETRRLEISMNLAPEQTLTGENRLTVLITQDSIVDVQQDGALKDPNYIHRHMLRRVVSAPTGDLISEPLTANSLVKKTYSLILPAELRAEHCYVVAYVHHSGDPDKVVLQVTEAPVVE